LAALSSAFLWALAAILFSRLGARLSAVSMNIGKGLIAFAVMGMVLVPTGLMVPNSRTILLLGASGIIGICLGDTLYFLTLMRLGSRLTLLLGSLIPVSVAVLAMWLLDETVNGVAWWGIILTIMGVTYVLWERSEAALDLVRWRQGLLYGLLFVFANAVGIMCTKIGVQALPSLDATFYRQAIALIGFVAWGTVTRQMLPWVKPLTDPKMLKPLFVAAIIGALLGTWLSVLALKFTYVTVAVVLNSTSPLFILPLSAWFLRERVSLRSVIGAVVAFAGIAIYFVSLES
jgi:drug/metabolite transporter (DMT)-like permease